MHQGRFFEPTDLGFIGLGMSGAGSSEFPRENNPFYIGREGDTLLVITADWQVVDGEEVSVYDYNIIDQGSDVETFDGCAGFVVNVNDSAYVDYIFCSSSESRSNRGFYRVDQNGSLVVEYTWHEFLSKTEINGPLFQAIRGTGPFSGGFRFKGASSGYADGWKVIFDGCTGEIEGGIGEDPDTGIPDAGTDVTDTSPDVEAEVLPDVRPEIDTTDTNPEEDPETDTPEEDSETDASPDVEVEVIPDVQPEVDPVDTNPEEDTDADAPIDEDSSQDVRPEVDPLDTSSDPDTGAPDAPTDAGTGPDTVDDADVSIQPGPSTPSELDSVKVRGADGCSTGPKSSSPKGLAGIFLALAVFVNRRRKLKG
jgi:hypothetical protein